MTDKSKPTEIDDADLDVSAGLQIKGASTSSNIELDSVSGYRKNGVRFQGVRVPGLREQGNPVAGVRKNGIRKLGSK